MREYRQWRANALTEGMTPDERSHFDEIVDKLAALKVQMYRTHPARAFEQAVREVSQFVCSRLEGDELQDALRKAIQEGPSR